MDRNNAGRIKKYGVCLNDKCANYKQIREIMHGDYECPECKKKLSPCAPPKKKSGKNKLIAVIVGAIAVVVVIIFCMVSILGGNDEKQLSQMELPGTDTTAVKEKETDTVVVTTHDTVRIATEEPNDGAKATQNGNPSEKNPAISETTKKQRSVDAAKASKSSSQSGKNLGYATYTGPMLNGKPHGTGGKLKFKSSHVIDSRDSQHRVADAGDYVIGEFNNGHLVSGKWYGSDGVVKGALLIGM